MSRRNAPANAADPTVSDYRYDDQTRTNNPPAALAAQGKVKEAKPHPLIYNPHLPPILRFDNK